MADVFGNMTVVQSIQTIQTMLGNCESYDYFNDNISDPTAAAAADDDDDVTVAAGIKTTADEEIRNIDADVVESDSVHTDQMSAVAVTRESSEVKSTDTDCSNVPAKSLETDATSESTKPKAPSLLSIKVKPPSLMSIFHRQANFGKPFSSSFGPFDVADVSRVLCYLEKLFAEKQSSVKSKQAKVEDAKTELKPDETDSSSTSTAVKKSSVDKQEDSCEERALVKQSDAAAGTKGNGEEKSSDQGIKRPPPLMSLPVCPPHRKRMFVVNPVLASHFEMQFHQRLHSAAGTSASITTSSAVGQLGGKAVRSGTTGSSVSPLIRPLLSTTTALTSPNVATQKTGSSAKNGLETADSKNSYLEASGSKSTLPEKPASGLVSGNAGNVKSVPSLLTLSVQSGPASRAKGIPSLLSLSGPSRSRTLGPQPDIQPLLGSFGGPSLQKKIVQASAFPRGASVRKNEEFMETNFCPRGRPSDVPLRMTNSAGPHGFASLQGPAGTSNNDRMSNSDIEHNLGHFGTQKTGNREVKPLLGMSCQVRGSGQSNVRFRAHMQTFGSTGVSGVRMPVENRTAPGTSSKVRERSQFHENANIRGEYCGAVASSRCWGPSAEEYGAATAAAVYDGSRGKLQNSRDRQLSVPVVASQGSSQAVTWEHVSNSGKNESSSRHRKLQPVSTKQIFRRFCTWLRLMYC
jgi:hypothetical protein